MAIAVKDLTRDAQKALRNVIIACRDPGLLCWAFYLLLVPLYVFESGLPQPGDWLILPLIPLARMGKRGKPLPAFSGRVTRMLRIFVIYLVMINLMWSVALGNWVLTPRYGFMMPPVFYTYNAIMFVNALVLYRRHRERFLWFTAKVVFISLIAQVVISVVHPSKGLRVMVLFNNANQLGFFALLCASLLFMFQRRKYVSTVEVTIGMFAAAYLGLLSASKAALGGLAMLALFGALVRLRTILLFSVVVALSLTVHTPLSDAIDRTITRFETDQSNGTVEERGYDRIYNNPQYLITGSGEGDYERFRETTVIGGHEIHSSIGTLVFCYGFIGLGLFAILIWMIVRGSGLRNWLLVAPSFAYGMAHQGLRFTMFWVLLAMVVALRCEVFEAKLKAKAKAKEKAAAAAAAAAQPKPELVPVSV